MAKFRFILAEKTSATTCRPIKGMRFNKFESASALGIRLSEVHRDIEYLVIDTETNAQYLIVRDEEGGEK